MSPISIVPQILHIPTPNTFRASFALLAKRKQLSHLSKQHSHPFSISSFRTRRKFFRPLQTMASSSPAPYAPQNIQETTALIQNLEQSSKKGRAGSKSIHGKKSTFVLSGTDGQTVDSWRFLDWDYKRDDLPTYARGLFTYRRKDNVPEIAIRGYDKFFNVGEVNDTQWRNVEKQTKGPYELSVKENGCIIFIGGLEDDRLLVCSKHSTGPGNQASLSHAVAGEKWIDKHLASVGKTKTDLARELRKRNVTAVAELCDDSFEEHVLAYEEKDAGLYLHGMNLNLPEFATYPGHLVHQFANEWGFRKAQYVIKEDIDTVRSFLEGCAKTGSWDGRDTEGFVIRCEYQESHRKGHFHNWFFKYKFEEPYLMYRQWRECTKAIISGKAPKYKKHKKITEEYLNYARRQLAKTPGLGKAYNLNHGIIAMRDGFLAERGVRGSDVAIEGYEEDGESDDVTHNVILAPVATIGCGKTTVAVALTKLFRWGHVQNDNIQGKGSRPQRFVTQVCNTLAEHPVTIADRNNHQRRERKQLIDDIQRVVPTARIVALHYVHHPKDQMIPIIRKVTQRRVLERGDNHQTIQAATKGQSEVIGIMEGFLERFEPVDPEKDPDTGFDEIIDLDVRADSRENLETVVTSLHNMYPNLFKKMPTTEDLNEAINAALKDYQPDIKHDLSFKNDKSRNNEKASKPNTTANLSKPAKLEYFSINLSTEDITSILDKTFSTLSPNQAAFYHQLQHSHRIQPAFHVTLIHRASIRSHPDLWIRMENLHKSTIASDASSIDPTLGKCRVRLERVVWDSRIMCIVARLLDEGWETANATAHVTIGTTDQSVKPKESNDLLQKWLQDGKETFGIQEKEIEGNTVVHGTVRAVVQGTWR